MATATCTVAPSRRQYKWGTDQNIGEEIFAEYKYTLNELLVTKLLFNTFNSLRDMTLGVNFSRHVLAKTATMQRINARSIFNTMLSNLASV